MHDLASLKDQISVIGVGNTRYGNFPDTDEYGLAAQAFRSAVDDCGISKQMIDGLLVCASTGRVAACPAAMKTPTSSSRLGKSRSAALVVYLTTPTGLWIPRNV